MCLGPQGTFDLETKGTLWALPPLGMMLLILYGHIPWVGGVVEFLAGPGLLLLGLLFFGTGEREGTTLFLVGMASGGRG
jgi:hypothetical protein